MKVILTGGAGFIGANAARRHLARGDDVVVVDDLSRRGAGANLEWLIGSPPHPPSPSPPGERTGTLTFVRQDVRDGEALAHLFAEHADAGRIVHLAGQVAVTTSVADPRGDFEANALGTFNVLEAARRAGIAAPLLYSSTNKVYGGLEDLDVVLRDGRWAFAATPHGVGEERPLDFHSPYGCSKGAADQYVRDYHRIYGLPTVVLRQSCIYGERQFGIEDQGWVAWFTIASRTGAPITVYGDGRQVRDVLWVDDLLDAFDAAAERIATAAGRIYNLGGGPANVLSLLELLDFLGTRRGAPVPHTFADWRPGDQKVFVADVRKAEAELGWKPKTGWREGLAKLDGWVAENLELFGPPAGG